MSSPASVPLPPGMTAEQYLSAQDLATNLRVVSGCILALFLWDYVVLLPQEVQLYTKVGRSELKHPGLWCFLVLRYFPFIAAGGAIAFSSYSLRDCQAVALTSFTANLLLQVSGGGIFVLRSLALLNHTPSTLIRGPWTGRKTICWTLLVFYLINVGSWIAVLPGYGFSTGPKQAFGSNCINPHTYSWAALSYGTSMVFDAFALGIVLYTCPWRNTSAASDVLKLVIRDGALYFGFTTVANLICFAVDVLPPSRSYLKAFATPFAAFAVASMGQRVYLHLKLLNTPASSLPAPVSLTSTAQPFRSHSFSSSPSSQQAEPMEKMAETPSPCLSIENWRKPERSSSQRSSATVASHLPSSVRGLGLQAPLPDEQVYVIRPSRSHGGGDH